MPVNETQAIFYVKMYKTGMDNGEKRHRIIFLELQISKLLEITSSLVEILYVSFGHIVRLGWLMLLLSLPERSYMEKLALTMLYRIVLSLNQKQLESHSGNQIFRVFCFRASFY